MLLSRFNSCIETLRKYTILSVKLTKEVLIAQREQFLLEKNSVSKEVKLTALNATRSSKIYRDIISYIENDELPVLQHTLKFQQNASFKSGVVKLTIGRIAQKKEEVHRYKSIIGENDLRVKQIAKKLLVIIKEIDKIEEEMNMLEDCLKVQDFLASIKRSTLGIAPYENERLHKQFLEGRWR